VLAETQAQEDVRGRIVAPAPVGQVNPRGADPERVQPPVSRLEQVDAGRVRERTLGLIGVLAAAREP
jgi:hypothetical protein